MDPLDDDRDWNAEAFEEINRLREEGEALAASRESWSETNKPLFASDLVLGKTALPPRLFEDFLFSRSLVIVSGEPHSGKSMFLLALLASLDMEVPLFGLFAPAATRPVLFLGQDSPPWDYQHQLSRLAWGLAEVGQSPFMRSLCMFNRGFDLLDPKFWPWLSETVRTWGTKVLMIDTLLEHHGQNENDNGQMKLVMEVLKRARDRLGLTVIFSHHTAKPVGGITMSANYRARGASCIVGSVDQHILVRGFKGGMRLSAPKLRGGDIKLETLNVSFESGMTADRQTLRLVPTENPYKRYTDTVLSFVSEPRSRKAIQDHLRTSFPDWTPSQLLGRTSSTLQYLVISKQLTRLERSLYGPSIGARP